MVNKKLLLSIRRKKNLKIKANKKTLKVNIKNLIKINKNKNEILYII